MIFLEGAGIRLEACCIKFMKKMILSDAQYYACKRGEFEYHMSCVNLAFMVGQHLGDETGDYVKSESFDRLLDKVITAAQEWFLQQYALLGFIFGENNIPSKYRFSSDCRTLYYEGSEPLSPEEYAKSIMPYMQKQKEEE